MADQGGQGTGKHPHKKASEPFEHHGKDDEAKGSGAKAQGGSQGKGGGREDDEAAKGGNGGGARAAQQGGKEAQSKGGEKQPQGGAQGKGGEDAELKAREYTDAEGNVHHHTKAYMEQHKGE